MKLNFFVKGFALAIAGGFAVMLPFLPVFYYCCLVGFSQGEGPNLLIGIVLFMFANLACLLIFHKFSDRFVKWYFAEMERQGKETALREFDD